MRSRFRKSMRRANQGRKLYGTSLFGTERCLRLSWWRAQGPKLNQGTAGCGRWKQKMSHPGSVGWYRPRIVPATSAERNPCFRLDRWSITGPKSTVARFWSVTGTGSISYSPTDFPSDELTAIAPPEKALTAGAADNLSRVLTVYDITPEHQRVLSIIPQRTIQSVASLFERKPKSGRFSALDVAQKLNFIAEVTAVPYRTMKQFSDQPGTLGLMMGRGLSVSLGTAR
jgi:hypothetical protein